MSIAIVSLSPINPTVQASGDLTIFTGIVQCAFNGSPDGVTRDSLSFLLRDPNEELADLRIGIDQFKRASATVSLASIACGGSVNDALWAVDSATVNLANLDRGTGTANIQVVAMLAVIGTSDVILRVNYTVFVNTTPGAILVLA
jgi:ethanolamine utilization microcompartment shell protein EutS